MSDALDRTAYDPRTATSGGMRAAPAVGTRIGKYIVERVLGEGGMGVVVAARHEHLGELVAIKVMHAKLARDAVQAERFAREAKQTVRIRSERVVRVLDAGLEDDTGAPYLVMEYLEGRDLGLVLSEDGPLAPPVAVDLMLQVCEAVAAAHALGIVHRDLKPSNFFLTRAPDGSPLVKVLDFGIAKALASEGVRDAKLTDTQAVFGSPTYMSPEQIRSAKSVDQRSDIWSLGVAIFELTTGKLPFIADNMAGLLASIVADPPFPLTTFASVPPGLEAAVLACLVKDREGRTPSVARLAADLAPFASLPNEGAAIAERIARIGRNSISPEAPAPFPSRPSLPLSTPGFAKTTGTSVTTHAKRAHTRPASTRTIALVLAAFVTVTGIVVAGAITIVRRPAHAIMPAPESTLEPVVSAAAAPPPPEPAPAAPPAPRAPVLAEPTPDPADIDPPAPRKHAPARTARPPATKVVTPAPPSSVAPVTPRPVDPARDRL